MSELTYTWFRGRGGGKEESRETASLAAWREIKTPPFSTEARVEAGALLRRLQEGEILSMPHSRPMASIGHRCHELRVLDKDHNWRIIYRIDKDAIVIAEVIVKKAARMPATVIDTCQKRLRGYDKVAKTGGKE